jgi:hypothetical protein
LEKRQRNVQRALDHLLQAADLEGGPSCAAPSTLLNLSAAFLALGRNAEAAATAQHGLLRAQKVKAPWNVEMAAFHNLAAALCAIGELREGLQAAEHAMAIVSSSLGMKHPTALVIVRTLEDIRQRIAVKEAQNTESEWKATSLPLLLPKSTQRPHKSLQGTSQRRTPSLSNSSLSVYCHSPTVGPSRKGGGKVLLEPIGWNSDPHLGLTAMSHRVQQGPVDFLIQQKVAERYVPRSLVPLVEDLIYKEGTRRRAIVDQRRHCMASMRKLMQLHYTSAADEELRGELEVQEARVRRMTLQWVTGKILFAEGSIHLERTESSDREGIAVAAQKALLSLKPYSERISLHSNEETARSQVMAQDSLERKQIRLGLETLIAESNLKESLRNSKRGLALALGLWCLESVLGKQAIQCLQDDPAKQSLHIQERYATFGQSKVVVH